MTAPSSTAAPALATGPVQGQTFYPRVLNFPVGSTIPEYIIADGVQVYAILVTNQGGAGAAVRIGLGPTLDFINWPQGMFLSNGCYPFNEGIRLDVAGIQTETIQVVAWTYYTGGLLGSTV